MSLLLEGTHVLEQPSFQETPESRAELRRQKVKAQAHVALKADPELERDNGTINVAVDDHGCVVTLSGMVSYRDIRSKAEHAIAALADVKQVNNELQVLHNFLSD